MATIDFPEDPEDFAEQLEDAGMPTERALVCAYHEHYYTNSEMVDVLGKDKSTVSSQKTEALNQREEARKLSHYLSEPEYLSELPEGVGKRLDEETEHTIAFRLHRPRVDTDDAEYSLENCDVVEGFYVEDDAFLIKYNLPGLRGRGSCHYFTLESQFLVRFLHDWVIPVRNQRLREGRDTHLADQYFLTDAFEPEWLEEELAEVGIERVEVLTDDRFTNPLDEEVEVSNAAPTGIYHTGYRVGYSPTDRELGTLLTSGDITEEDAERITRKPADDLRKLVGEDTN